MVNITHLRMHMFIIYIACVVYVKYIEVNLCKNISLCRDAPPLLYSYIIIRCSFYIIIHLYIHKYICTSNSLFMQEKYFTYDNLLLFTTQYIKYNNVPECDIN